MSPVRDRIAWRGGTIGRALAVRRHYAPPIALLPPPPPPPYNAVIPSTWDSAYDRAMMLHYRDRAVTGVVIDETGYPHTPPVQRGWLYRVRSGPTVLQYDGMAGAYVPLAQADAARALASVGPHHAVTPIASPAIGASIRRDRQCQGSGRRR